MYNSSHIDPRDVQTYKRLLDHIRFDSLSHTQKLAFAQAMELKAVELRQESADVNQAAKNDIW
jgi:hypothetical protein